MLGAAFKPDSDDIRDSPALDVATAIRKLGGDVVVYDPEAMANAAIAHPDLRYADSVRDALTGADLALLLTEWQEFRALDPAAVAQMMAAPKLVDGRNVLDPVAWRGAGFSYRALGRP